MLYSKGLRNEECRTFKAVKGRCENSCSRFLFLQMWKNIDGHWQTADSHKKHMTCYYFQHWNVCSIFKGLHACSCCWTWQDVHTFIGFTIRCRQSEQARCWLLRLMYRPVWCKHLECIYNMLHKQLNPMGRLGCTLLSLILNKPMTPFRTVFFRLAGTDIRKKTHGKKFCTQKFGRAEPFYANMEKYRLHPAIFALEILLCHFPTDFHYICIALKLQQTSHSQLPAVAALCHVHMLCLHEDKTERERK